MRTTHAALAAGLLAVTALHAQQTRPTFRSGTETVSIYATVRASDGRLVPDLTREDFEIRDNGAVRDVTVFSREIVPITVAMMLDMSGSQEAGVTWMRDAAGAFVDQLLPADRARIGTFGVEIAMSPRLTGEKRYLHRVLDEEVWPGGATPLWDTLDEAMSSLRGEEGRRVILALTDGLDTVSGGPAGSWSTTMPGPVGANGKPFINTMLLGREVDISRRATREGFMIYGVGHQTSSKGATTLSLSTSGMSAPMISLASDSGGGFRIFRAGQDAVAAMIEVAEELHHQYLIGFTPAAIDNKVHKLDVKVKRGGMTVRARRNYLAEGK